MARIAQTTGTPSGVAKSAALIAARRAAFFLATMTLCTLHAYTAPTSPRHIALATAWALVREIGELNAGLLQQGRKYVLIGPGRWGSADRWLGIPVSWAEICGVGAMVETASPELKAEPSQGSHFFHNISTLGINYVTVSDNG